MTVALRGVTIAASAVSTPGTIRLVGGLLLALVSAAAINLGFLLQHHGLRAIGSLHGTRGALLRAVLHSRAWLAGQALGWVGFAAQIVAVTLAPLALVQSFAAGGLALSVPLAARLFGHRVPRRQRLAVLLVACGLATLALGLTHASDRLANARLAGSVLVVFAVAIPLGLTRLSALRAIAAGLFYGVADAAIKAVSVGLTAHGRGALESRWTLLALVGTFLGFLAFQGALRTGSPVTGISLMNCFAAMVALLCGLVGFGESLGGRPVTDIAHVLAIALVLACVPVLAAAQSEIADTPDGGAGDRAGGLPPSTGQPAVPQAPGQRTTHAEQQGLHHRAGARAT